MPGQDTSRAGRCRSARSTKGLSRLHAKALLGEALDARSKLTAGGVEAARDPFGVLAARELGAAEVEQQPDQLDLPVRGAGAPQRHHPEVVAKRGIDGVVVEPVAEVVEQRAAITPPGAVEDMRRMPGDEIRAGVYELLGRAPLPAGWSRGHVRAPVREGDDEVGGRAKPCQLVAQPAGDAARQVGVSYPGGVLARRELERMIAHGEQAQRRASGVDERAASRSEEHTSELQSREKLVCRLLLE